MWQVRALCLLQCHKRLPTHKHLLALLSCAVQVTDYINFQMLEATTDQLDLVDMAGWEQGLFTVCLFVKVAAFLFWVVYIFEIIQAEVDALRAQQEVSTGQGGEGKLPRGQQC